MLDELKRDVCQANRELARLGLVIHTFGNVSGIDRESGRVVIKPSGVPYDELTPDSMAVVDLDGRVVDGDARPSSDTATHVELYRAFGAIGGVCHTHSPHATMFAQALRGVPCFGTTHADVFNGEVPVTCALTEAEVAADYEANTGRVIVERFVDLDAGEMPAVLVAHHGPFTWGRNAAAAVESSWMLEEVARTAVGTLQLARGAAPIPDYLLAKHYGRKHGPDAYYGQQN
jgi:L-ribulose-5-phosphate 4-epimerase